MSGEIPSVIYRLVGEFRGERIKFPLREGRQTVGRSVDADLRLSYPNVSRRHAQIVVNDEEVTVDDLGSRNGTLIDGVRISKPTRLLPGRTVSFAGAKLRLEYGGSSASGVHLSASAVATSTIPGPEARTPTNHETSGLFNILARAGEFLVSDVPLSTLYENVLTLVEGFVPCDRIVLLSIGDSGSAPAALAHRVHRSRGSSDLTLSRTMMRQVLDDGVSLLTTDAQSDQRFRAQESVVGLGVRAAMAAPLYDNQEIIGLLYADTTDPGSIYTEDELRAFTALANLIAVKITQARLAEGERERKRLERELKNAREILNHILPRGVESVEGYDIAVAYEPCTEVGGDFYDVRHLDDERTVFVAGDVAGKGLGAAVLVSSILPAVRLLLGRVDNLAVVAAELNKQICSTTDPVRYATLFLAVLDRATGSLEYVNAGHNPPVLIHADGGLEEIGATCVPLGLMEASPFAAASVTLESDAMLAVFSDGIDEALGPDEEFYDTERIRELLCQCRGLPAGAIVQRVLKDVRAFARGTPQSDDIVLLVIKRQSV